MGYQVPELIYTELFFDVLLSVHHHYTLRITNYLQWNPFRSHNITKDMFEIFIYFFEEKY